MSRAIDIGTNPADGIAAAPASGAESIAATPGIRSGTCFVMFAYDVGFSIDLDEAERRVSEATAREGLKHKRRAPRHFEFRPAPLRIMQPADPIRVGPRGWTTASGVECVLYDFGAVSVSYAIPIGGGGGGGMGGVGPRDLDGMLALSDELYDNAALLADSRRRVEKLLAAMGAAVAKPELADLVEDYVIYQIREIDGVGDGVGPGAGSWVERHAPRLAQILRSETAPLSSQEIGEAMLARASYSPADEAVIDWNAAVLVMKDAEEVRAILEFANVELLEVRHLDDVLDRTLERGYEAMARESRRSAIAWRSDAEGLERLARLQVDHAVLFEGVNNALKLIGDQYLARVYRLAGQRLHLPEWDASILRKLETIESIYQKIHDRQSARRMELLEWIIIVLIAVSIIIAFVPGAY